MTTPMTKLEKLRYLVVVLERVERERLPFDMSAWYKETECGTAACAAGWATLDPVFQAQGLRKSWGEDRVFPIPTFAGRSGFGALERFFGITSRQSDRLFWERGYASVFPITPRDVIARVQTLIDAECGGTEGDAP